MKAITLLSELRSAGVELRRDGDRLRCRAPNGVITDAIRNALFEHKAELLELLQTYVVGDDVPVVEYDPPAPCSLCGGLTFWWSFGGDRHCMDCTPPTKSIDWLAHARRIREKLGMPPNAAGDRTESDLRQMTKRD